MASTTADTQEMRQRWETAGATPDEIGALLGEYAGYTSDQKATARMWVTRATDTDLTDVLAARRARNAPRKATP